MSDSTPGRIRCVVVEVDGSRETIADALNAFTRLMGGRLAPEPAPAALPPEPAPIALPAAPEHLEKAQENDTNHAAPTEAPIAKRCKTCGQVKPLNEFPPEPRCQHGRLPHCRTCNSAKKRAHRQSIKAAPGKEKPPAAQPEPTPAAETRTCKVCGKDQPREAYYPSHYAQGYRTCRECLNEKEKAARQARANGAGAKAPEDTRAMPVHKRLGAAALEIGERLQSGTALTNDFRADLMARYDLDAQQTRQLINEAIDAKRHPSPLRHGRVTVPLDRRDREEAGVSVAILPDDDDEDGEDEGED